MSVMPLETRPLTSTRPAPAHPALVPAPSASAAPARTTPPGPPPRTFSPRSRELRHTDHAPSESGTLYAQPHAHFDRISLTARKSAQYLWVDSAATLDTALPHGAPRIERVAQDITGSCLDVLLGHRPASAMRMCMAPEVHAALARRASLGLRIKGPAPANQRPRVRKVVPRRVRERAYEVSVLAHDGQRGRAVAMRLEWWHGRWRVMALEIG